MRTGSLVRCLCLFFAALTLAACSGGGSGDKTPTPSAEGSAAAGTPTSAPEANSSPTATPFSGTVTVHESEFKIEVDHNVSPETEVSFVLRNDGTMPHEFDVLKTDLAADKLPVSSSTGQVDLTDSRLTAVFQYPAFPAGQANLVHLSLQPGHYVFICNLPGHYTLGMHADFSVSVPNQGGGQ